MKKLLYISLLLILHSACKKDAIVCNSYILLNDRDNLFDPKLTGSQALLDTLAKHPEYQVTRLYVDQYGWVIDGNVFYQNLKIFSSQFMFFGGPNNNNNVATIDTVNVGPFNLSLTPTLTCYEAIRLAREQENFSKTCIAYRLGIYDINAMQSNPRTKNYKLVWLVQGDNGSPYVYLDANTGQTYFKDDGIEI